MSLLYRARAGVLGMVAALADLGMELVEVPDNVLTGKKYTIGPEWAGMEYPTIQEAVDAAVADGHSGAVFGQTVLFELYPGVYPAAVTIPATLPRWNLVGVNNTVGSTVSGIFTVQMPATGAGFGISQVRFSAAFNVTQAVTSGSTLSVRLFNVAFLGGSTVSCSNLFAEAYSCIWNTGAHAWTVLGLDAQGGRFLGTGVFDVSASAGGTAFQGVNIFNVARPILTFRGRACSLESCLIYYSGSLAVLDECSAFSEYTGNTWSRNAGPVGGPVQKTGASSLTDGGNRFVDGVTYPYFVISGGARPNRGQTDDELRRVSLMAGSPLLTPDEVGAQRKTTIAKTGGGGTVTLPLASAVEPGCTVIVKDLNGNATASPFNVVPQGPDTIDGLAAVPISTDYQAIEFQAVGAGVWMRIGGVL